MSLQICVDQSCYTCIYCRLMDSLKKGEIDEAKLLLKNADVYGMMNILPSIVHHCMSQNGALNWSERILNLFFEKVSKDFFRDDDEITQQLLNANDIVKFAAVVFGDIELARVVLKNGFQINFREPTKGFTALHCTVMFGKINHAKMLIELGANVNTKDHSEYVPLQYYLYYVEYKDEQSELLEMLLSHSVISNAHVLKTVINLITNFKKRTVRMVLKCRKVMNWYIHFYEAFPHYSRPIFDMLLQNPNDDILDLLEEFNIKFDVNRRTFTGDTPLMIAVKSGSLKKVTFLLKYGVDVNFKARDKTALLAYVAYYAHWTSQTVYGKITELLLRRGAALACESLTGLISDVACKIIDYLGHQDWLRLSMVQPII